jgi:glycosyltransferase involved in cell wall biosynthesis
MLKLNGQGYVVEAIENHYNIGWWPWEFNVWPKKWMKVFELVDELWGGSDFTFKMYQKYSEKTTKLIPLAVSVDQKANDMRRSDLGLPDGHFLFLYIFDFNSNVERKNPFALVESFMKSFSDVNKYKDVGLVIKTMNFSLESIQWIDFIKLCIKDKRIHVINQVLPRSNVLGLIEICNVYVSTHRSEGFGRTIAEAILLGKLVIATNYSGNVDFMKHELTKLIDFELIRVKDGDYHFLTTTDDAFWANISIKELSAELHQAYMNKNLFCAGNIDYPYFKKNNVGNSIYKRLIDIKFGEFKHEVQF